MKFDEMLWNDMEHLLSESEFSKEHNLNGTPYHLIELSGTSSSYETSRVGLHTEGITREKKILYIQKAVLDFEPFYGQTLEYDEDFYTVLEVTKQHSYFKILIGANTI